jgi:hypothetical protein
MIEKDTELEAYLSTEIPPLSRDSEQPNAAPLVRFIIKETEPRHTHKDIEKAFWDARMNGRLNHRRKL